MTSEDLWGQFAHDPRSPAYASMRASDADRDVVLRAVGEAYAQGRLDAGELDERTTGVQAARTLGELPAFLAELVPATELTRAGVPAVPALSQQQLEAEAVARWRRSRGEALRMWLFVSVVCWTIWLLGSSEHAWPIYPMLGTAIPLIGTLVQRQSMIEANRRKIVAKHAKAVAKAQEKAERKRAELESAPPDEPAD